MRVFAAADAFAAFGGFGAAGAFAFFGAADKSFSTFGTGADVAVRAFVVRGFAVAALAGAAVTAGGAAVSGGVGAARRDFFAGAGSGPVPGSERSAGGVFGAVRLRGFRPPF